VFGLLSFAAGFVGCTLNHAPLAILSAPSVSGAAPFEAVFDLSYSSDPNGDAVSYTLDFGDGTEPVIGTDFRLIVHHTYDAGGTFLARLTVVDSEGNSSSDRLTITVNAEGPPVGLLVGKTAPDFTAHTTSGRKTALSEYRGEVVLVDFWGAWCPPCRARMPHLQDLHDQFAGEGFVIFLVSTDLDKQDAIDFLTSNGYTDFISVWEPGYKSQNPIAQLYQVNRFPHTFLLDRQGVIRYAGHPDDLPSALIESLL
jgi:peroxiredoxin